MDLNLKNKVFMVAASSQGLGFGVAEALAAEGANLAIASRSSDKISAAADKLSSRYAVRVIASALDAASAESIGSWCKDVQTEFGRVDGLLINSGGPPPGKFDQLRESDWELGFQNTLMSAVRMIREVWPLMKASGGGSILTITSTSIKEPIEVLVLSNVFRSGVASLVKSLAEDLARDEIRINNIVPGRIDTERLLELDELAAARSGVDLEIHRESQQKVIPLGRYGTAAEFGKAAAFLLSDAASYISGSTLVVDGGRTKVVW